MTYRTSYVPVDGGELAVGIWGDDGPLVVAAHGITSHHLAYGLVAVRSHPHDFDALQRSEQRGKARAHHGMIIGEYYPDIAHDVASGNEATT